MSELAPILDLDGIAEAFHVSRYTAREWCSGGKVPAFKQGRGWYVRRSTLEAFLARRERETQGAPPTHDAADRLMRALPPPRRGPRSAPAASSDA